MARRKPIPSAILQNVLLRSKRRCPVCFVTGNEQAQEGAIAHLDMDPSNNELDNLAFLCLDHHAKLDRGESINPTDVKKARAKLYSAIGTAEEIVKPKRPWARYEELVAATLREELMDSLGDKFTIYLNRRYPGRSGAMREVDIAVELTVVGFKFLIVFEIKYGKRKLGVADVSKFVFTLDDIAANKGVIVSNAGFSSEAARIAATKGIALVTLDEGSPQLKQSIIDSLPIHGTS